MATSGSELHHVVTEQNGKRTVIFHDSFSVSTESGVNDNAATENVLVKALKHVLDDDSFKINTPSMIQARKSAESLLD